MSLAENLLNSLETTNVTNSYSASNEEPHIVVGADRNIIVPQSLRKIAVTGDTGVETVTFDCVRYWDGNDLSTFAIYLNYVLPDRSIGTYIPKSITANDGEDAFHFDWEINRYMTKANGTIAFSITAIKTKLNDSGETVVDKQWGSFPNTECSIVEGVDIANVPDNEETADILAQISGILEDIRDSSVSGGSSSDVPSYWLKELQNGSEAINTAMCEAGRNKSAFLFYSDAHWNYGSQMSPKLLKYLYKNTGMTKTFFGGDIVHDEASDYDTMEYLWDWRKQLKDLPNHHSVVGNHDDGNSTNNLFSAEYVYGYLLAPEETPDMVLGDGLYYYIDNPAEKTRYICLDTGYQTGATAQTAMRAFLAEALKSTQSGWHIVVVSHIWYGPDYDRYSERPIPIAGMSTEAAAVCTVLDNYNARSGEFASGGAKVEFCIGGHVHRDYVDSTDNGIPIVLVETDSMHLRGSFTYTAGTTSESSVNGIVADYNTNTLHVIRVGRGVSFNVDLATVETEPEEPDTPDEPDKPTYTNVLDTVGYIENKRFGSDGTERDNAGTDITGWIPVTSDDHYLYLKNVTMPLDDSVAYGSGFFLYDSSKTKIAGIYLKTGDDAVKEVDSTGNNPTKIYIDHNYYSGVAYVRLSADNIDGNSIITINEPIE